jgi:hypothetical protein
MVARGFLWGRITTRTSGFKVNAEEPRLQELIAGTLPLGFIKALSDIWCSLENPGVYTGEDAWNHAFWSMLTVYWGIASEDNRLHKECPSSDLWAQKFRDFLKSEEPCTGVRVFNTEISSRNYRGQ